MAEFHRRESAALAMGGSAKLARRKAQGVLNARERIDYLCDPGSFIESGLFGTSATNAADRDKTPADGKIAGFGRIQSRETALVVNDFTVMGASSSSTNGRKIAHMKQVATRRGLPLLISMQAKRIAARSSVTPSSCRTSWKCRAIMSLPSQPTIHVAAAISSPSREACR